MNERDRGGTYYGRKVLEKMPALVERIKDFYKDRLDALVLFGSLSRGEFASYGEKEY